MKKYYWIFINNNNKATFVLQMTAFACITQIINDP